MSDRFEPAGSALDTMRPLAERLDLGARLEPYSRHRWKATRGEASILRAPTLHIDDVSAIPFLVGIAGVEEYQHRARLRVGAGGLYCAVTLPTPGYESYCERRLGLPAVQFVHAPAPEGGLQLARACLEAGPWGDLVAAGRREGRLAIHPYMGIEDVWELAERLSRQAGVETVVLGPPPPVTWIANDKALFGETVLRTLGRRFLVESRLASDAESLTDGLSELASRHPRVGLKRLRCASAMGNEVFESAQLRELSREALLSRVGSFLERTEWDGSEEVLAEVWEETEHSPSTQLWIPPADEGPPLLEGVYEQILTGEEGVFVGSRTSTLPKAVNRALRDASLAVARSLQVLGYVGRCSFDLLVVGDVQGDFEIRFTECNGRWGGTSTPMSLLDRLWGAPANGERAPYRAQDFIHADLVGARFVDILEAVGDAAWDAATGEGKFIFYNTGPLEKFGKLDVIALGDTRQKADEAIEELLPRLLGL